MVGQDVEIPRCEFGDGQAVLSLLPETSPDSSREIAMKRKVEEMIPCEELPIEFRYLKLCKKFSSLLFSFSFLC
jgi:hypothetical protein